MGEKSFRLSKVIVAMSASNIDDDMTINSKISHNGWRCGNGNDF